jgi:hypothetical protein
VKLLSVFLCFIAFGVLAIILAEKALERSSEVDAKNICNKIIIGSLSEDILAPIKRERGGYRITKNENKIEILFAGSISIDYSCIIEIGNNKVVSKYVKQNEF